ncbi:MAG: hypothetical protein AAF847_10390 [Bacteroidota bacterium]
MKNLAFFSVSTTGIIAVILRACCRKSSNYRKQNFQDVRMGASQNVAESFFQRGKTFC